MKQLDVKIMDLEKFPRVHLANLPTPLESLSRFSKAIGGGPKLFIKRDDETGLATGGNKVRKLEFLLADAIKKGADVILTMGASFSNHCRMTAAAACKLGLDCTLALTGEEPAKYEGNLFLSELFNADLRFFPPSSTEPASEFQDRILQEVADDLREHGRTPYVIPVGGAAPLGEIGYVLAVKEIQEQASELGVHFDYIVVCKGSGGTMAGLIVGANYFQVETTVMGFSDSPPSELFDANFVAHLTNQIAELIESDFRVTPDELSIFYEYAGPGYNIPTTECARVIKLMAQTEGILLEPVYTGKTMAGLVNLIKKRTLTEEDTVLFVHTGGLPGLFREAQRIKQMLD